jgi:ABC-type glycerol-3-phosphate transport system substrate-binding protein
VGVDAMNEWAQKNAPGLKFAIETLPWTDVYPKLMTDLAAGRPAGCISVESPIAFQLMAEGLLEPVDDLVEKIGRDRLIPGAKWEYWGAWKGKQYVIPAHHQSHLLVVRTDVLQDAGVTKNPAEWNWNDLLGAAKAIRAKTKHFGLCIALGRTIATDYYLMSLLHSAGGRMFDAANKSQVVFDSPAAVETFQFIAELFPTMPPGAVGYTFLDVVDSMATGQSGMVFYWGRVFGRAAEVNPNVFKTMEAYQHAAHPKTGKRLNWNDFQGLGHPQGQQSLRGRGEAGARPSHDEQGLADPLRAVAGAQRLAGVPGRGPGPAPHPAPVLRHQAPYHLRVLRGSPQARE